MNLKRVLDSLSAQYNDVWNTEICYYEETGRNVVVCGNYEVDYNTLNNVLYSMYSDNGLFSFFKDPDKDEKFKLWCARNGRLVRDAIKNICESSTYRDRIYGFTC